MIYSTKHKNPFVPASTVQEKKKTTLGLPRLVVPEYWTRHFTPEEIDTLFSAHLNWVGNLHANHDFFDTFDALSWADRRLWICEEIGEFVAEVNSQFSKSYKPDVDLANAWAELFDVAQSIILFGYGKDGSAGPETGSVQTAFFNVWFEVALNPAISLLPSEKNHAQHIKAQVLRFATLAPPADFRAKEGDDLFANFAQIVRGLLWLTVADNGAVSRYDVVDHLAHFLNRQAANLAAKRGSSPETIFEGETNAK